MSSIPRELRDDSPPPPSCLDSITNLFLSSFPRVDPPSAPSSHAECSKVAYASFSSLYSDDLKEKPLTKDSKILIFGGGGTLGSSTALHLARRGYTDLTILDPYPIPSAQSAGNDLNKIAGGGDNTGFRGQMLDSIMRGWREDPVFKPYYHEVGRVTGVHSSPEKVEMLKATYERGKREGWGERLEWLGSEEEVTRKIPQLEGADIAGWKGIWSPDSGWVAARESIASVGRELERLGVKMIFGESGTFSHPVINTPPHPSSQLICTGAVTKSGLIHQADRIILACGAWTPALIDLKSQCVSKCWILGHLRLTKEEMRKWEGVPVLYHDELGFFIEPQWDEDGESGVMKICNEFPGYTRLLPSQHPFGAPPAGITLSVPRSHADHPTDTIPSEGLLSIQHTINTLLPSLAIAPDGSGRKREMEGLKLCWCGDTADAEWLLCEDPRWKGLFLATGDSGHSFHTLPWVGSEIADCLEGKLSEEKSRAWGWRPGAGDPNHTGRGGPPPKDIGSLPGWAHEDDPDEV